jgi:hypothetical protein
MYKPGTGYETGCPQESWIFTQPPGSDSDDLSSWIRSTSLYALLSGAGISLAGFPVLSGGTLGSTSGSTIILDIDAAGYGWFIDYTPYLDEKYLPTSNPYEWIVRRRKA